MTKTIYKLARDELLQAVADYLTKKYYMTDTFDAAIDLQIDGKTGGMIVEVTDKEPV